MNSIFKFRNYSEKIISKGYDEYYYFIITPNNTFYFDIDNNNTGSEYTGNIYWHITNNICYIDYIQNKRSFANCLSFLDNIFKNLFCYLYKINFIGYILLEDYSIKNKIDLFQYFKKINHYYISIYSKYDFQLIDIKKRLFRTSFPNNIRVYQYNNKIYLIYRKLKDIIYILKSL